MTSLRRRIRTGTVLWMFGLIWLTGAVFTLVIEHFPGALQFTRVDCFIRGPVMVTLATIALTVGTLIIRRGLNKIDALRADLANLDRTASRRLKGEFPSEIQPLVDDLNTLLDTREKAIERAVAKAGDLAHGLKTPLAILAQDVDRARAAGQDDLAASISQQVTRMKRQVDYHLSQTRAAASGGTAMARASVLESAEGLRRAMLRLFADRGITIDIQVTPDVAVRVQREDLDEMLGNLIENACKWTRTRVVVSAHMADDDATITVDDDGTGLAPGMREAVLQRGVRADEAAPGTGLGLAIVRDLAELYGGSITLSDAPTHGLRAALRLPR
jgi:signal transduction histidine kinase